MSPTNFHDDHHAKSTTNNNNGSLRQTPSLRVNKGSKVIKHSSPSPSLSLPAPSSSSSSSLTSSQSSLGPARPPVQQRHRPVIIYTHSPKIIHTHPKDFMALVQKLTGLSRSDHPGDRPPQPKAHGEAILAREEDKNKNDDNESSSVITEENCGSNNHVIRDGQVNSCFVPPIFEAPNPCVSNIPVFATNSADFLCANHQPFYGYTESLFIGTPSMRSSISSASTLEGINDFNEF